MDNLGVVSAVDFYLEKAFYLFGFIMLGMAWLTFRAGSTYQQFKNADKLNSEGRGSFTSHDGPEMIRRLKLQTLIWYILNCVVLVSSTIIFGYLFFLLHSF